MSFGVEKAILFQNLAFVQSVNFPVLDSWTGLTECDDIPCIGIPGKRGILQIIPDTFIYTCLSIKKNSCVVS